MDMILINTIEKTIEFVGVVYYKEFINTIQENYSDLDLSEYVFTNCLEGNNVN
jgi:hypothetical protein